MKEKIQNELKAILTEFAKEQLGIILTKPAYEWLCERVMGIVQQIPADEKKRDDEKP